MALVLGFLVVLVVKVGTKSEAERQKREPAVPERRVLGTLSDRAFAAEDFIMSAAAVPEAEQELIHKGRELVKDKNYQAAIDCLTLPKEGNSWFAARLYYLGCALHHLNRNQEAVDVFSKFIEYQSEANAYSIYRRDTRYYRAKALIALDRTPEAVSDLTAAIEIAPAAELHELRATAHEKLGNADAAQRDRRRAAELDPPLNRPGPP
jgi:tetratricopeptide (TPR) repeat protein